MIEKRRTPGIITALGLVAALLLSGCSSSKSAALEPLSQICWGVKYLSERSWTIQDDELKKAFTPLIESAKELDPESIQVLDMAENLDGAFEIGRLTKAVNAQVEAMQYSNMPTEELVKRSGELFDELAKSKFPQYINDSCLEIRKQKPESDLTTEVKKSLKIRFDAYIKSVQESPYELEYQRAEKAGASAAAAKKTRDMQILVPFCVEKAAPKFMDELVSKPSYSNFSRRQIENIQGNFIFACENWWGFS